MSAVLTEPSVVEMTSIVERAQRCLTCDATPCNSGSPCYEFTPGGVEVCSDLPWWNGKPVMPETLRNWKQLVTAYEAVPRRPDD